MEKLEIAIIRFPVVMTKDALEMRQYTDLIHRHFPPFLMGKVVCPLLIRQAVQPLTFTIDINAGFIGMSRISLC